MPQPDHGPPLKAKEINPDQTMDRRRSRMEQPLVLRKTRFPTKPPKSASPILAQKQAIDPFILAKLDEPNSTHPAPLPPTDSLRRLHLDTHRLPAHHRATRCFRKSLRGENPDAAVARSRRPPPRRRSLWRKVGHAMARCRPLRRLRRPRRRPTLECLALSRLGHPRPQQGHAL